MNEQRQEHTVEVADLLGLFARSLRRLWWLCLMLIVLCAAAFGGYARLSYRPQYMASMTFLVNVCLLYTSPSPRDMRRSRMPSSA